MATQATSTETWDEITTRHLNNYVGSKEYKDNFYKGRPLLQLVRERKIDATGGKHISHKVRLSGAYVGKSIGRGGRIDLTDVRGETTTQDSWAALFEPYLLYFHDMMESDGSPEGDLALAEDKLADSDQRLQDMILFQLCQTSKVETTDLNTLLEAVATTGAFGNLNPATAGQEVWAAQNEDTVDFSSAGIARLRALYNKCSQGGRYKPDAILLPRTFHQEAMEVGDAAYVINADAKTKGGTLNANLGMQNVAILGLVTIWDYMWTLYQSAKALMLNFDGLHLVENPAHALKMGQIQSGDVYGLPAKVALRRYVAQLTVSNRNIQGSMTTIS